MFIWHARLKDATRFLAIVWAALIIGLFHVHLAREIKRGVKENSAQ